MKRGILRTVLAAAVTSLMFSACTNDTGSPTILKSESIPISGKAISPTPNDAMPRANVQGTGLYTSDALEQSGTLKWEFKTEYGAVKTTAAVARGIVYFGGGDGYLYALTGETGKLLWKYKVDDLQTSSPAIIDNTVYVGGWQIFYALDANTGQEKWSFRPESGSDDRYYADPIIAGGLVYFGSWHDFYALDSKTGREEWKYKVSGTITTAPTTENGVVYFGTYTPDGRESTFFYALDAKSGQEVWKLPITGDGVGGSAVVMDGVVYVGTANGDLYALEAKTGQEKWLYKSDSGIVTSPALAYGMVFITQRSGLHALDAKTGQEMWSFRTSSGLYSDPSLAGALVYFVTVEAGLTSAKSYLHAVEARTGQQRWQFEVSGLSGRTPVIADGVVYFGGDEGFLYAIR